MPDILTREQFQMAYPDLFRAIVDEAFYFGAEEGLKQGRIEGEVSGAEKERTRIQAVEGQLIPGHEALINSLKFDGVTTGPEAAVKVLASEKSRLASFNKDFVEDGQGINVPVVNPPAAKEDQAAVDPNAPIETRAEAEWKNSPEVRAEFKSFSTFLSFRKAEEAGQAKIFKGGK